MRHVACGSFSILPLSIAAPCEPIEVHGQRRSDACIKVRETGPTLEAFLASAQSCGVFHQAILPFDLALRHLVPKSQAAELANGRPWVDLVIQRLSL